MLLRLYVFIMPWFGSVIIHLCCRSPLVETVLATIFQEILWLLIGFVELVHLLLLLGRDLLTFNFRWKVMHSKSLSTLVVVVAVRSALPLLLGSCRSGTFFSEMYGIFTDVACRFLMKDRACTSACTRNICLLDNPQGEEEWQIAGRQYGKNITTLCFSLLQWDLNRIFLTIDLINCVIEGWNLAIMRIISLSMRNLTWLEFQGLADFGLRVFILLGLFETLTRVISHHSSSRISIILLQGTGWRCICYILHHLLLLLSLLAHLVSQFILLLSLLMSSWWKISINLQKWVCSLLLWLFLLTLADIFLLT